MSLVRCRHWLRDIPRDTYCQIDRVPVIQISHAGLIFAAQTGQGKDSGTGVSQRPSSGRPTWPLTGQRKRVARRHAGDLKPRPNSGRIEARLGWGTCEKALSWNSDFEIQKLWNSEQTDVSAVTGYVGPITSLLPMLYRVLRKATVARCFKNSLEGLIGDGKGFPAGKQAEGTNPNLNSNLCGNQCLHFHVRFALQAHVKVFCGLGESCL
jgi:hypothetical protein